MSTTPKRVIFTRGQLLEHEALARLLKMPVREVTEAYMRSLNAAQYHTPMTRPSVYGLLQPLRALQEAERDGRDFTPIFWHRTEDGVLHLTMWDVNKPNDKANPVAWSRSNSPIKW